MDFGVQSLDFIGLGTYKIEVFSGHGLWRYQMNGWRSFTLGAVLTAFALACATDVGTIDRTQHDKLLKKTFAGLWYYNQVVIDVPATTAVSFVGESTMGSINKIVWDIQEKYLVAYPTSEWVVGSEKNYHKHRFFKYWDDLCMDADPNEYQCIDGVDNKDNPQKHCCYVELYVGQPLAAFPILKHFDVKRKYNPATGAQTNVLEENTVDKKWWQRRYMRVDWSKNKINDYTFMARINKSTPIDYYVQEWEAQNGNPDAPTITDNYIDVVTKTYVDPDPYGCDVYMVSTYDCVPAVLKIRNSFRKVPPNDDYIPWRYHNDEEQGMFGYFLTQRQGFDKDWGVNYSGSLYLINHWNLWRDNFYLEDVYVTVNDANGQPKACQQAEDCGVAGAVCDNGTCKTPKTCYKTPFNNGCDPSNSEYCYADDWFTFGVCKKRTPKPYLERKLHPIVYWNSYDTPEWAQKANDKVVESWDKALKETVAWLYFWESKGWIYGDQRVKACQTDADCASHALADKYLGFSQTLPFGKNAAGTVVFTGTPDLVFVDETGLPKAPGKVLVRFINLTDQALDLGVKDGATLVTGVGRYDGGAGGYVKMDPPNGPVQFVAGTGGSAVAESNPLSLSPGMTALVVLTDKGLFAVRAYVNDIDGYRVLNASDVSVDVGYHGTLAASNLPSGGDTGYLQAPSYPRKDGNYFPPQRFTIIKHGDRGDITCYREEQQGVCIGWYPKMTEEDKAQWQKIYDSLPHLFVICKNQYDGGAYVPQEDPNVNPWQQKLGDDGKPVESHDMKWISRAYDGTVNPDGTRNADGSWFNPCVDGIPLTENMTEDQKLQLAYTMKKEGDSRFSMIYYVPEAQLASPLGYSPSAADPDTGEVYWAMANIYGAPMRTWATYNKDIMDLVNGNLDVHDYITGQYVRDYLKGVFNGVGQQNGALTAGQRAALMRDNFLKKILQDTHTQDVYQVDEDERVDAFTVMKTLHSTNFLQKAMATLPYQDPGLGKKRLEALKGTPIEQMLITPEIKMIASHGQLGPNDSVSQDMMDKISPLSWLNLENLLKKERESRAFLAQHNFMSAAEVMSDENLIYTAKKYGCYKGRPDNNCYEGEDLVQKILELSYYSVTVHEVGHTLGLRHNFAGSTDLFNYFDDYYKIREKEKVPCHADTECEQVFGQFCYKGYCAQSFKTQCSADSDCGKFGAKCISGECYKAKECGHFLECGEGEVCDTTTGFCVKRESGEFAYEKIQPEGEPSDDPSIYYVKVMIPRPAMTKAEMEKGRSMYQYSSIMDYGQRWNSDIFGPGKYDKAAIRFGYGKIVDVYQDPHKVYRLVKAYADMYGIRPSQMSFYMDPSFWNWSVYMSQFYFMDYAIGPEENLKRFAVPWDWVKLQHNQAENYFDDQWRWYYVQVPYKFSSDEYEGNVGIYMWDTGVDPLEIVYNMMIRLKDYYIVDAFMRERYGFGLHGDPYYYFARVLTRYMDRVRLVGMFYALYAHILKEYSWRGEWANSRLMGWTLRRASELAFTMLANSLASPAPGSYKLDQEENVYKNISYQENVPGSQLNVPLGIGKFPFTKFMDDAGYYYFDHALWIGSFWEKIAALLTLTDSTVYFTTNYVGEQLDVGVGTSIGFNTMYTDSLLHLFGGLIADDYHLYADMVDDQGNIEPRLFFDPENKDAYSVKPPPYYTPHVYGTDKPAVQPSLTDMTMKLFTAMYGLAYLPASFEPAYLDAFVICVKGTGECKDIDTTLEGIKEVDFEDPFSGKTYITWTNNYGRTPYSPMARLFEKVNDLKSKWENATGDEKDKLERKLHSYVNLIEQLRQLYQYMNYMRI